MFCHISYLIQSISRLYFYFCFSRNFFEKLVTSKKYIWPLSCPKFQKKTFFLRWKKRCLDMALDVLELFQYSFWEALSASITATFDATIYFLEISFFGCTFFESNREKVFAENFEIVYEIFCTNLCPQNVILLKNNILEIFWLFLQRNFFVQIKNNFTETNLYFLIKIFNSIRFCRALNIVLISNLELVLFYHHNWEQMRDFRISQIP